MKTWFCNRGYPQKLVDAQLKVSEKSLDELFTRPNRKEIGLPCVATYHPCFHNLSAIARKYFTFFHAEEKVKRVFTTAPFRNPLVKAKVYPFIRKKGTFCCEKSRCET